MLVGVAAGFEVLRVPSSEPVPGLVRERLRAVGSETVCRSAEVLHQHQVEAQPKVVGRVQQRLPVGRNG